MAKTMNKEALIERLYEFDMFDTKKQSREFLGDFLTIITEAVANGDTVSIAGFGKFEPYEKQNGEITPKFRPFEAFKIAVAK